MISNWGIYIGSVGLLVLIEYPCYSSEKFVLEDYCAKAADSKQVAQRLASLLQHRETAIFVGISSCDLLRYINSHPTIICHLKEKRTPVGALIYKLNTMHKDDGLDFNGVDDPSKKMAFIWMLFVDTQYRRQGIAKSLIAAATKRIIEQQPSVQAIWLTTSESNGAMQNLARAVGAQINMNCYFNRRVIYHLKLPNSENKMGKE